MSRAVEQGVQELIREASPLVADMDEFKDSLLNAEEVLEGAWHKCQRCQARQHNFDFCTFCLFLPSDAFVPPTLPQSLLSHFCACLLREQSTTSVVATLNCLAQETIHQELQGAFFFWEGGKAQFFLLLGNISVGFVHCDSSIFMLKPLNDIFLIKFAFSGGPVIAGWLPRVPMLPLAR